MRFRIDFWIVEVPTKLEKSFADLLEQIGQLPNDISRNYDCAADKIRVQHIEFRDGLWEGDMARIRMEGVGQKRKWDGTANPIDLEEDEGLSTEAAFLFDPSRGILVTQRNQILTASLLARYVSHKLHLPKTITMRAIAKVDDVVGKMRSFQSIRKFEVGISHLGELPLWDRNNHTFVTLINMFSSHNVPILNISLSMGHEKGGLTGITELAQDFLGLRGQQGQSIKRLMVSGTENDEACMEILDLLNSRVIGEGTVEQDADRCYPLRRRLDELRRSYLENDHLLRGER